MFAKSKQNTKKSLEFHFISEKEIKLQFLQPVRIRMIGLITYWSKNAISDNFGILQASNSEQTTIFNQRPTINTTNNSRSICNAVKT